MVRVYSLALLPLIAVASGCTGSTGETYLGRPGSPAWFATAAPQTIADYYAQQCASYGFKPGTVEMAQCIQSEAQGGRNRAAVRQAASAPVTCNTFGNTTTCY